MKYRVLTWLQFAALVAMASWPCCALADEPTFCPDYAQKESVLQQGNRYLQNHPAPYSGTIYPNTFEPNPNYLLYSGRFHEKPELLTQEEIAVLPLNTERELFFAQKQAYQLENLGKFELAYILHLRLLAEARESQISTEKLATELESTARTAIFTAAKVKTTGSATPPGYGIIDHDFLNQFVVSRTVSIPQMNSIRDSMKLLSPPNLMLFEQLEKYYSEALAIRKKWPRFNKEAQTDRLCLAAVEDNLGKLEQAKFLYEEAFSRDHALARYLVAFFREHKDFDLAKKYDSAIIKSPTSLSDCQCSSLLLDFYLKADKVDDAKRIFAEILTYDVPLDVDTFVAALKIVSNDDAPGIEEYLCKQWLNKPLDHGFIDEMAALESYGWGTEVDHICQRQTQIRSSRNTVPRLFIIADCMYKLKKYDLASNVCNKIQTKIDEEREPDEDAITNLSQLIALLGQDGLKQLASSQQTSMEARKTLAYHKDQIRRRQCFSMAEQLNQTAAALEGEGHYAMAQKLYKEALEIKVTNLSAADPEIAMQQIDVARTVGEQHHYGEAQLLYEKALTALKANKRTDPADRIAALESYGEMLNNAKLTVKAEKMYAEARVLAKISAQ